MVEYKEKIEEEIVLFIIVHKTAIFYFLFFGFYIRMISLE